MVSKSETNFEEHLKFAKVQELEPSDKTNPQIESGGIYQQA